MNKEKINEIFAGIAGLHVVVVGDVMLDNYWWGDVERVSPEAPVPIVTLQRRESRLGGAANVALNCATLGAKVTLASVIGNDAEGILMMNLAKEAGINTDLLQSSKHRPTTNKTRVMSRNQHMMRLDDEVSHDLLPEEEHPFINEVLKFLQINKPAVVIFEDYNKGVLKENVIQRITAHCNELGIVTAVDPKRKNFFAYKNVTVFKPNLKEVNEALNLIHLEAVTSELDRVHQSLKEKLGHTITFVTLSDKGVYYHNGKSFIIPSHLRNISDVSGAGDTVIATAALVYAVTKDAALMAEISNIAGGLVCEEVGVVPINKQKLLDESISLLCK
jgi:rfaE bifunctional protein kinase chain/domain